MVTSLQAAIILLCGFTFRIELATVFISSMAVSFPVIFSAALS